nr:hypothetical protein [Tanacetum cinerariifolium]
ATVRGGGRRHLGRWYVFVFYVDDESKEDDDDGLLGFIHVSIVNF